MAPPKEKKRTRTTRAGPSTPAGPKKSAALNPLADASPALAGPPLPKDPPQFLDGVRVIPLKEGGPDLVGSDVSLCGYLGLADTSELRELHSHLSVPLGRLAAIINEGYQKEQTGKEPAKTQIEVSKLFGYISQQNEIDISGFDPTSSTWPLPVEGSTFHATHRPFLYWIKTLYDILTSGRGLDISTRAPEGDPAHRDPEHFYWAYASEDWHRVYYLVKNWLKKSTKKTARSGSHTGTSKPQTNKAVPVRYYAAPDADPHASDSEPEKPPAPTPLKPVEFDWIEDPDQMREIEEELEANRALPDVDRKAAEEELLAQFEEKIDKLVSVRTAHKSSNSRQNPRPALSYTEQVATIKSICNLKRTPVQFPPNATVEQMVVTTQEKEAGAKATREGQQESAEQVFTRKVAHLADIMVETDTAVDDQQAQQTVENIQKHISTISAIPPSYEESCKALQLDPELPRAPGVHPAKHPYFDEHPGAVQYLKPHQVQFLHWALIVEPALGGLLLADEMGLGKTVQALCLVVQYAIEHGADVKMAIAGLGFTKPKPAPLPKIKEPTSTLTQDHVQPTGLKDQEPTESRADESALTTPPRNPDDMDSDASDSNSASDSALGSRGSPIPRRKGAPRRKKSPRRAPTADPNKKALALAEMYDKRKYKPNLVVAPSSGFIVWKQAKANFPATKIRFWQGNKASAKPKDRPDILGATNLALMEFLNDIPDTPQALLVVVVTTYTTLHLRTTYLEGPAERRRAKQAKEAQAGKDAKTDVAKNADKEVAQDADKEVAQDADKEVAQDANKEVAEDANKKVDEDDHGMDSEGEAEDVSMRRRSWIPGVFGRVICDEAQKIKDPTTRSNRAVRLLQPRSVTMLTGTPMLNTTEDMNGLLWAVWDPDWESDDVQCRSVDEYSEARKEIELYQQRGKWSQDHVERFRWLLNPVAFARFTRIKDFQKQMEVDTAHSIVPPILMLLSLRRHGDSVVNVNGKDVRIGESIPNGKWLTVELGLTRDDSDQQVLIHQKLSAKLTSGFGNRVSENETGRRDHGIHRRLCHSALNPALETLYSRVGQSKLAVSALDKTYHEYNDHGASFYLQHTRPCSSFPNYHHRGDLAKYISMYAPKLRALAGFAHQICNVNRRKLLIFCDWPTTQWNAEMLLCTLGFKVLSMRSAHSTTVRDECVEAFTKKDNIEEVQAMFTSTRIASTAFNLQGGGCCDVLFLDIPNNAQTLLQAGARVMRMGQEFPCNFYILTVDGTYDQATQANQALKMRPIIAGQAGIAYPTHEECVSFRESHPQFEGEHDSITAPRIVAIAATKLYTNLLGQRSSREDWNYPEDRTAKNTLRAEEEFRERYDIPPLDPRLGNVGKPFKEHGKPLEKKEASKIKAVVAPLSSDSSDSNEPLQSPRQAKRPQLKRSLQALLGPAVDDPLPPDENLQSPRRSEGRSLTPRFPNAKRQRLSESMVNSEDDSSDSAGSDPTKTVVLAFSKPESKEHLRSLQPSEAPEDPQAQPAPARSQSQPASALTSGVARPKKTRDRKSGRFVSKTDP